MSIWEFASFSNKKKKRDKKKLRWTTGQKPRLSYRNELCEACGGVCSGRQCFLLLPLVHLLNLYPCALLLFSSWLLSYCHPCSRIAARRNDRNREIGRKAIIVNCRAGIMVLAWVGGAADTLCNQTTSPLLTDLDQLAPKLSVATTPTG